MADAPAQAEFSRVELRSLIGHAHFLRATATVEEALPEFARVGAAFLAVLDGPKLIGVCARRELDHALSSRYGFALNAKRPVSEHVMNSVLAVATDTPLTEVFKAAARRADARFFDDVLLVNPDGSYAGLIGTRTLGRLQTEFLLGNIDRLEASRREIAARNREMEADLAMAREVQLALLPETAAVASASGRILRLAHLYRPAGGVSGDFFDVIRPTDETVGVLVCDVMGHGVRSALITAMIRAIVEELRPIGADPAMLMTRLNRDLTRILRRTGDLIFVTAVYVVLPLGGGRMRYAQAGHPAPLLWDRAAGSVRTVAGTGDCGGPALGLMDDFDFATGEDELAPGNRLILFTDGLFEATSRAGEEFGRSRLERAIALAVQLPLGKALESVAGSVAAFSGAAAFADDLCVVAAEA